MDQTNVENSLTKLVEKCKTVREIDLVAEAYKLGVDSCSEYLMDYKKAFEETLKKIKEIN